MNVHHKCQKKVANLCGVNQKLMAEALAVIESKQQVRVWNWKSDIFKEMQLRKLHPLHHSTVNSPLTLINMAHLTV